MSFIRAVAVSIAILSVGLTGPVLSSGTVITSQTLTLKRTETKGNSVWGELWIEKKFICYTLENDKLKIPSGTYKISKGKKGFRLHGVEGRSNINIEAGNYPFESLGCIFVGLEKTPAGVRGSRAALWRLAANVRLPAIIVIQDVPLSPTL